MSKNSRASRTLDRVHFPEYITAEAPMLTGNNTHVVASKLNYNV